MMNPNRRWLGGFTVAVALALFPGDVRAQTVARSFEELQSILKVGQTVVVTDDSGGKQKEDLRTIAKGNRVDLGDFGKLPCAGVYAEVVKPGVVRRGDTIRWI